MPDPDPIRAAAEELCRKLFHVEPSELSATMEIIEPALRKLVTEQVRIERMNMRSNLTPVMDELTIVVNEYDG